MKTKKIEYIDFEKVNTLLEAFNKTTGYVTAILDLEGNILSKSGWRKICTDFHRVNPETSKKCTLSDTVLAGKLAKGEQYHFYKCLNGLVDVAVPVIVKGEHIANLFSGQLFFEKPDVSFFKKQAAKYGFNEKEYLEAFEKVPVISLEEVKKAMDFLLGMTRIISEMTFQKQELIELNKSIREREDELHEGERRYSDMLSKVDLISITLDMNARVTFCNDYLLRLTGWSREEVIGANWFKMFIPHEDNKLKRTFSAVLHDEPSTWHYENRILTRKGEFRTIRWNNTVLRSPDGKVIG
ncbi:MAG TPA: PocR ligand-binding domain-containing protein, partial [Bacteroidales bacterium]|nr:PocR ligand-binding domain-containing protein [Bacteroidales bacterium]